MRKVCGDYTAIFNEIEENPTCTIQWNFAGRAAISKPRFIPLDRRKTLVRPDAIKSEESINAEMRFPLMHNESDNELQPASSRLNSTRTDSECLNTDEPEMPLQQSHVVSAFQRTDLPSALVQRQENELEMNTGIFGDHRNCKDISADCAAVTDNHDSAAVISCETLPENPLASSSGIPGNL